MSESSSHNSETHTGSESESEQLLANAVADYLDLRAREVFVDIDEYCSRYGEIGTLLRSELEAMSQVDQVLDSFEAVSSTNSPEEAEPLPASLSGHTILRELGSGSMGRVLLAHDEPLDRDVAIKVLHPRYQENDALRTRFMQEARAMAKVTHPNIVRVYNLGSSGEVPHFVMEYVNGANLAEVGRALPLNQRVELMVKVALAVEVLHQHRVLHRDLKPGNILVGPDLEPKVLDFGLAQSAGEHGRRLTRAGDVMGTPDYFSPEQARGEPSTDARSDIFALGTIFYELLTGILPFRAESFAKQVEMICKQDPILPRRMNSAVPGDLQNVCLKALEKNPADRYGSAREMADDLERYLAGEGVLAAPTTYSRLMAAKVENHVRELAGWKQDHIVSEQEFNSFQKLYGRLFEKEDAWILEVRQLTEGQVALYLGAWILVLGAALVFLFEHSSLAGTRAVLLVSAATIPTAYLGIRCWRQGLKRVAIAYLLAFCLLLPTTFLVSLGEWRIFTGLTHGEKDQEFFAQFPLSDNPDEFTTNAQVWWSIFLSLPAYLGLRRFTRSSVFSLVVAVALALLCLTTLLRMGLLDWINYSPEWFFLRLIPVAILFFITAIALEVLRFPADSRYFYPLAVFFIFAAFTGLALTEYPNSKLLEDLLPFTLGQHEYLFIINALYYLCLQSLTEAFGSPQMRSLSKVFRLVIPGHVMTSLFLLGLSATDRWHQHPQDVGLHFEARVFEVLLPAVACAFVFGSISKQMKNYLVFGLIFVLVGIVRLQQNLFEDRAVWPISLLIAGTILMFVAAKYPPIRLSIKNLRNSFRKAG
jgi:serine/threonine-protein kinase